MLYATAKFSHDLTIDIPLPTLNELLEIKKMTNSSPQTSFVDNQIDKSAFGLFLLVFGNEVYKKTEFSAKLWDKFTAVGRETWSNVNEAYRDAFDKLAIELNSRDE
ncbi:7516_t:CDS:1 [Ambispora gerdemannii]|uniref:7516_t:CDS:1 n=1 Tax=Ambispora gerdemannii TaxID=144530 RepID=A0A9N9FD20_9GLOM|nr:7516_t:CDS:1 [Ambispora gerdemannii]